MAMHKRTVRRYGKACDLWSVGVIMFTLLCGFPPFWGDTERDIYARVRRGYFTFEGPDWAMRSAQSKDLIKQLLIMIPKKRLTVDDALAHPWIVHEGEVVDPHSKRIVCAWAHRVKDPGAHDTAPDACTPNLPVQTSCADTPCTRG